MNNPMTIESVPNAGVCFFTLVTAARQRQRARLFIESLRTFGGRWSRCPVWVFDASRSNPGSQELGPVNGTHDLENVHLAPLVINDEFETYFKAKVYACARAEELAGPEVRSLVWLAPESLILRPPALFDLAVSQDASKNASSDAAFRTVHHRNVGSLAKEPLDGFWQAVYRTVGIDDAPFTIESFADLETIRPYFNTHCFAIDPAQGIGRAWWDIFKTMASDRVFQSGPCRDQLHRIFLHQAVLSALVAKKLERARIRLLPPEYSYPLHMHDQVPSARRARTLNDLVCAVYEDEVPLNGIEVQEPLRSWLGERVKEQAFEK